MKNIWQKLNKPIFIQAPMENVTDSTFRRIIAYCGKPDLFFTEFTSVEGLFSPGFDHVTHRLKCTDIEKPIIAQIWGTKPEAFLKAGKLLKNKGFDGIDINMGCPDRTVLKKGAGASLTQNTSLAKEIITATLEGSNGLPVSVKTRLGFNKIITEEWIGFLLSLNLDALTIHGRTAKQQSEGDANWEEIKKAVDMRNHMKVKTLIIGNGDIKSRNDALERIKTYDVDGVMIGRGIFGDLWIFNKNINASSIPLEEKLTLLLEHIRLFEETWGDTKNFLSLKKFYKVYINGFSGASDMRMQLVNLNTLGETKKTIQAFIANHTVRRNLK